PPLLEASQPVRSVVVGITGGTPEGQPPHLGPELLDCERVQRVGCHQVVSESAGRTEVAVRDIPVDVPEVQSDYAPFDGGGEHSQPRHGELALEALSGEGAQPGQAVALDELPVQLYPHVAETRWLGYAIQRDG